MSTTETKHTTTSGNAWVYWEDNVGSRGQWLRTTDGKWAPLSIGPRDLAGLEAFDVALKPGTTFWRDCSLEGLIEIEMGEVTHLGHNFRSRLPGDEWKPRRRAVADMLRWYEERVEKPADASHLMHGADMVEMDVTRDGVVYHYTSLDGGKEWHDSAAPRPVDVPPSEPEALEPGTTFWSLRQDEMHEIEVGRVEDISGGVGPANIVQRLKYRKHEHDAPPGRWWKLVVDPADIQRMYDERADPPARRA